MEKGLRIMPAIDTINYVLEHECSVARFGDGEIDYLFQRRNIGFQEISEELKNKLSEVIANPSDDLLLCMPSNINSVEGLKDDFGAYWLDWASKGHKEEVVALVEQLAPEGYVFGDTQMTRPYMDYQSSANAEKAFPLLRKLWNGRDVLIVEGAQTRLGIGNDLFDNVKSTKRILAPPVNAFASYDKILQCVLEHYNGELILLAVGPTATVLASDLAHRGIRALDIGHVDIEYEWFLKKAQEKVVVEGKYVNEVFAGRVYTECTDENYLSQIIATVE